MKCFDLSEVKMIIKENILTFKEHWQIFMIFFTPVYDVRRILESYQKKLQYDCVDYFFDYYYRFWFSFIHLYFPQFLNWIIKRDKNILSKKC